MTKRFRVPPRIQSTFDKTVTLELGDLSPGKLRQTLEEGGLQLYLDELRRKWLPSVGRILSTAQYHTEGHINSATAAFETPREEAERLCEFVGLVYLGRRIGNFVIEFRHVNEESGEVLSSDDTLMMISSALNRLSAIIGENSAAEIFRRLERVSARIIAKSFGSRESH